MENDKLLERLKKLLTLAKRGMGGEAANAKKLLDRMMKEHGVTYAQLEVEEVKWQKFKVYTKHDNFLLNQILFMVKDTRELTIRKHKTFRWVELTDLQKIEAETLYIIYRRALKKEQERCTKAFIQANNIFGPPPDERPGMTQEEMEEIMKVLGMASGMEPVEVRKAIT